MAVWIASLEPIQFFVIQTVAVKIPAMASTGRKQPQPRHQPQLRLHQLLPVSCLPTCGA